MKNYQHTISNKIATSLINLCTYKQISPNWVMSLALIEVCLAGMYVSVLMRLFK